MASEDFLEKAWTRLEPAGGAPRRNPGSLGARRGARVEVVTGIFIFPSLRDASPLDVSEATLVAGRGLRTVGEDEGQAVWDRYASGKGSYSHKPEPGRQVTLISSLGGMS